MTSLRETADRRVFASVTAPEDLVRLYVPSHELAGLRGENRPEAKIVRALAGEQAPQRLHIYGEAGAGKTSLILRALADIARRENLARPVHPLFVNTGDAPSELDDPHHFMRMILGLIRVNGGAFASVDPRRLLDATAEQTTHTPSTLTHEAGITAPIFSYQASLTEAFASQTLGHDPARVRNDFEDVLETVTREYRAVIVIDDTDHFAASSAGGELDEQAIANLYHHGASSRTPCSSWAPASPSRMASHPASPRRICSPFPPEMAPKTIRPSDHGISVPEGSPRTITVGLGNPLFCVAATNRVGSTRPLPPAPSQKLLGGKRGSAATEG